MAIASGVMSGAQAINNFQKAKKAEKQAMVLGNQMNAMKIKDVYGSLQAPNIAQAAYDQTARAAAQATQSLQSMGPEGAAQIANLNQSVNQANLDAANAQAQANYERDKMVAEGRNQNAQYEYANKMDAMQSRIEGAQGAAMAGRENAMASIAGGIEGVGAGLAYDYGNSDKVWGKEKTTETPEQKAQAALDRKQNTEQIKTSQANMSNSNMVIDPASMWANRNKSKNLPRSIYTDQMDLFSYPK
jgi:hypothetical protein